MGEEAEQERRMSDLTSKAEVLETYAELFDMFDDSKEICKELCKVYDKIMGLPTIDAVPVVRCKDCKWKVVTKLKENYCLRCEDIVKDDYFCADGAKMEVYE